MDNYKPPFHMTDKMTFLIAEISEQVGRITILQERTINPHLRRENRIRTIHSSLAIEHNSLSLEQVTAILDGKRVLGNPNEIREVQNAYEAYELMLEIIMDSLTEVTVLSRSTVQDTDQVTDQDKSPVERLLLVLGDDTLSTVEIMKRLGLSHRPTFRKNYLHPALERNLIERTIPDKPNSRNQKYKKCKH